MGTQIKSNVNDSKNQMVLTAPLGASITVGDRKLSIFVGADVYLNQVETVAALTRCRDALFEFGVPNPVTLEMVAAVHAPGDPKSAVVITNGVLPTVTEGDVFIGYGLDFTYPPSETGAGFSTKLIGDRINAAIERMQEDVLKLA